MHCGHLLKSWPKTIAVLALSSGEAELMAVVKGSVEALGKGKKNAGGAEGRKQRWAVLDRLARLGRGLTPHLRNDFPWFKESWDEKMLQEHGEDEWPVLFASLAARVVQRHVEGDNGAFSAFQYNETERKLAGERALNVP